eukprot:GSChrysophyteH1.ASY1.ANO1.855.1 assembled CDS
MLTELAVLEGHTEDRVWHASWSPKGNHLATCGEDKVVRIWASATGDWIDTDSIHCIATLEDAQTRTVRCCEWSPSGKHLACASFDGTVVIWEAQDRAKLHWEQIASLEGHENEVKSVAWSRTGQWLATCGRDKKIWIWERIFSHNCYEFECVSMLDGHTQDVKFVQWHQKMDNTLFSCSYDDTIMVWGCDEGDDEFYCLHTITGHKDTVWGLAAMPTVAANGFARLASCSADLSLRLWDHEPKASENNATNLTGSWREVAVLDKLHKFPVYSVSWNADETLASVTDTGSIVQGCLLATGGGDNDIHIIHVSTDDSGLPSMRVVHSVANAHDGDINCVRWGPSQERGYTPVSHLLVSVADDGLVRLWKLTNP